MSESGCPGIADPGAVIVKLAHEKGIQVVPLVGPSSILLALMASGMNGQSFAFNGYLPIDKNDKKQALKMYERLSQEKNQTQLFIETPYRNNKLMEDLLQLLQELQRQEYLRQHLLKVLPVLAEMETLKDRIQLNGHFKNLSGFDL